MYRVTTQRKSYSSEQTISEIESKAEALELYSKSLEEKNYFSILEEKREGVWMRLSYCFHDENGKSTTHVNELFKGVEDTELKHIRDEIYKGREEGLRPRILDSYIQKVRYIYSFTLMDAWKYVEQLFWEEVGRRYFGGLSYDKATD